MDKVNFLERGSFADKNFLTLALIAAVIIYTSFNLQSTALGSDETVNLWLGKNILDGGYPWYIIQTLPLLPFLIALLFMAGFAAVTIAFILPLAFILLSVYATHRLAKELAGEKIAKITVSMLLVFPDFWRWGSFLLTDIPLMAFMTLTLLFFIRALRDRKFFCYMGVTLGLASATKITFIILPACIFLYLLAKRMDVLKSREFWCGIFIASVIFAAFFGAALAMKGSDSGIEKYLNIEKQVLAGETKSTLYGSLSTLPELMRLFLFFPIIIPILSLLVLAYRHASDIRNGHPCVPARRPKSRRGAGKNVMRLCGFFGWKEYLAIYSVLFMVSFIFWVVRLRYFSPLFPILMIFTAEGFFYLRNAAKGKAKLAGAAFMILSVISFLNAAFLISLDSGMLWGADLLSGSTKGMDGLFASDYLPYYLNMTNDVYINSSERDFFSNFSDAKVDSLGIKFIVISIYSEWGRNPDSSAHFHPAIGPIEIPFISRPYSNGRVPPGYSFGSDLYQKLETDPKYERIREISSPAGQKIFIIYEVVG